MTVAEFNTKVASKITGAVGTMWCAYLFAAIALISLPAAISTGDPIIIVAWIAQTFLQLVLLSIIMVGQDVQAKALQQKIDETHTASLAEFELAKAARESHAEEIKAIHKLLLQLNDISEDVSDISDDMQDIAGDADVQSSARKKPAAQKKTSPKPRTSR